VERIPSLGVMGDFVLPTVFGTFTDYDYDSIFTYDGYGYYMLFHGWISCG
jgi:hypothetical protein